MKNKCLCALRRRLPERYRFSLLKRQGIDSIRNVLGGWKKIAEQEKSGRRWGKKSVLN